MITRTLLFGTRAISTKNTYLHILRTLHHYSKTQPANHPFEQAKQLSQQIQNEPTSHKSLGEGPNQAKVEHRITKKDKKNKQDKPKQEKKEESSELKEEVGPKLFSQIDLRVSQILQCWKHPQSENLYCEKINVCGQVREIASGLQKWIPQEQMKGKVIVMANLKPKPLAGFMSNGMVICASNDDYSAFQLLSPEGELGERIFLQGFENLFSQTQMQPVLNPKKKVLERCLKDFKTDELGFVVWKGFKLMTKAGPIKAKTIKNGLVS